MAEISLRGSTVTTIGNLPAVATSAPNATLVTAELTEITLADFRGTKLVLNVFPSIDTGICATSVRKFNAEAANLPNTKVLCVSRDLPFALQRFCAAEGIENVLTVSDFRGSFGEVYGLTMTTGPLTKLLSRAVIVIDEFGQIRYTEQVPEIGQEPEYTAVFQALNS